VKFAEALRRARQRIEEFPMTKLLTAAAFGLLVAGCSAGPSHMTAMKSAEPAVAVPSGCVAGGGGLNCSSRESTTAKIEEDK
jgi:hypothetical protein